MKAPISYSAQRHCLLDGDGNVIAYDVEETVGTAIVTAVNQQAAIWGVLSQIADLCVADIAMGADIDAQYICDLLYNATGMTEVELAAHCRKLKQTAAGG